MTPDRMPILRPGETCLGLEQAQRLSLIVDAAGYFRRAKQAMLQARHAIYLIGWDFDLRIKLTPDDGRDGAPDGLGDFLRFLVRRRPGLNVYILKWDMAVLFAIGHQVLPLLSLALFSHRRLHFRLDSAHPAGAAQHQKIVVIDDAIAFCGGIDMTTDRWDTSEHLPQDVRRRRPDGVISGPWHDATLAVTGPAAAALGRIARSRWQHATGQRLPAPPPRDPIWPEDLEPDLLEVQVAIARTEPAYDGRPQVSEVERLYLEAIRRAERIIYLESQYFCSARVCDALVRRLSEADGPEIVVINPETAEGWLEEAAMGPARAMALRRIREADRDGRFRIYYPVNEAGEPIYVHAKVLTIDDRLLRVGSSNVNNRSMGFDSECDLAVEAGLTPGAEVPAFIARTREGLLAEHLSVPRETVRSAVAGSGSVIAAIERLRRPEGHTLRPLEPREASAVEEALVESRLADPERPRRVETRLEHFIKALALRAPGAVLGIGGAVALGAAAGLLTRQRRSGPPPRLGGS